ncbi:MAG: dodecin family protein [Halioglobus sp.]|jgi:dodecin
MSIAKTIEVSADSTKGFDAAVEEGIAKASETVEHIERAWIKDQIVLIKDGKVQSYRVHMNLTFALK